MIEPEFACFFSIVPTYTSVVPFGTQKLLHIIDLPYECYPSLSSGFVIRSFEIRYLPGSLWRSVSITVFDYGLSFQHTNEIDSVESDLVPDADPPIAPWTFARIVVERGLLHQWIRKVLECFLNLDVVWLRIVANVER